MMNKTFTQTTVTLGLGLFMILALARCEFSGESMHITILYETSKDLKRGDPVVYKDFEIGKVRGVALKRRPGGVGGMTHVAVEIEPEYADMLYHQMDFKVGGSRENRQIVVADHKVPQPRPVVEGDLVLGTEDLLTRLGQGFRDLTDDVSNWLDGQGVDVGGIFDEVKRAIDEGLDSKEVNRVVKDLERLAEESGEAAAEQIREILAYLKAQR